MKRVLIQFENDNNEKLISTEAFKISKTSTNIINNELLNSNKLNIIPNHNDLLCTAVQENKFDDVLKLLHEGVDPNILSSKGRLAIISAVFLNNIHILQLLLDRGANIDAGDSYGWTALHTAVANGKVEPARLLINKGARTDIKSKTGITALDACELLDEKNEIRSFLTGAAPYRFSTNNDASLENEENAKIDSNRSYLQLN